MKFSEQYKEKLNSSHINSKMAMENMLLQLEVTNACNHQCIFCPNKDSERERRMMDFDFAKRMIAEGAEFMGKNAKICFHMNGEPLLYTRLFELIQYAREKSYSYIFLTTNGSRATGEALKKLFDHGLNSIKFSINAGTRETYRNIHGRDDFDNVIQAVKFSSRYRKENNMSYKIFVSCVGIKQNKGELKLLKELLAPYADEILFYYPCAYAGQSVDSSKILETDLSNLGIPTFRIEHESPCPVLWNSINVTCEGFLSLCCSEANNRLIIEDCNRMSLKDAWFGKKMDRIRKKHLEDDLKDTPCHACIHEEELKEGDMDKNLFVLSIQQREKYKAGHKMK